MEIQRRLLQDKRLLYYFAICVSMHSLIRNLIMTELALPALAVGCCRFAKCFFSHLIKDIFTHVPKPQDICGLRKHVYSNVLYV